MSDLMHIEGTLRGTYLGKSWANVFHYTTLGTNPDVCDQFANAFFTEDGLLDAIQHMMIAQATIDELYVLNRFNAAFSNTYIISRIGSRTVGEDQIAPPYLAWEFKLRTASATVKRGWKRFAGVGLDAVEDGVYDGTTLNGEFGDVKENMEAIISNGGVDFLPVVASFTHSTLVAVTSVDFVRLTTQNSRKR